MQNKRFWLPLAFVISLSVLFSACNNKKSETADNTPRRMEILLLGHRNNTNHNSLELGGILSREYFRSGINISYTDNPDDLNKENLANYAGLIIYANHDTITQPQADALLDFVRGGKGLIALHSASFCFRNNDEVVEMIGGQFKSHKFDTIQNVILKPEHEVMKGITAFKTLDETYVHDKISPNIEVLAERIEGDHHEPYTWVRPYGEGRVFYTAYGHNTSTFTNQGFLDLVKNGILWAVGDEAKANLEKVYIAQPEYFDGLVPNYEKRDPAPRVQAPLTPEESMSLMQVPVGFELKLFASEPMIFNPMYMNWDEKGRLWVIETVDYPNEVKEDDLGDDRIKILEDTDGDGKADKVTTFAEKLNIPTSFVFSNGGIIVSQSPSFLFLKDTDGDDVADVREDILPGWGKNDTHAQTSNLRYGVDNDIWGMVGYSGYNGLAKQNGTDSISFNNAMYKFDPNTRDLEHLGNASNNTWGLGFSEEFDIFISTANNTHTAFFGLPKRYFEKVNLDENGVVKLDAHYDMRYAIKNLRQVDVMGGFTAAAGHSLYTAREFPKSYWNSVAFVTEPTGRLVHKVNLKQEGAGFIEDGDGWNLLTSGDEWAGPIQAEVGPDGAVWIADWYNFIIQHNPTPSVNSSGVEGRNGYGNAYVNPLRDRSRGRIYRVVYKGHDKKSTLKLSKDDKGGLIKALSNNNMLWRTHAQRLLVENQDTSVFSDLYNIIKNESVDDIGINAPAIHALWTLHGLGAFDGKNSDAENVAIKALSHPSAGVRRAAIQVLPKTVKTFNAINKAGLFDDADYRVRLAAVLATTEMEGSDAIGTALVTMAEKEENFADMWLKYALTISSKLHEKDFRAEFAKRGYNMNPSLMDASLGQKLAFGSSLNVVPLRRTFRRAAPLSPEVANNEWVVSGDIEFTGNNAGGPRQPAEYSGVVMVQGNRRDGYGLYFMDNQLHFVVNQNGKAYVITTTERLPRKFSFSAGLQQGGMMKLTINGKEVGAVKTQGLFTKNLDPNLGVRVGFERSTGNDKVANYPDNYFSRTTAFDNGKLEILNNAANADASGPVDQVIELNTLKDVMKYDKEVLTAKAGTTIQIVLKNPDFMQHNLVLVKPGTKEKVGAAADKLAGEPNGQELNYVPQMPEVLAATPLINSGGSYTLTIKLPNTPGDYPYICTFPGHWRIMQGVLRVN
ncbi:ThuA domain-containing protein [Flavobacteriaceae bacterium XHP0103]|uniref:PVC-type heme-binding CxxCH protein n=1 Tax=Marixanthotalea marina TaxID=2844359 RepID=UPI002989AC55|nr:PVC-type heme-binding CxxCH protein [Marixanthotalea marina]MBU3820965.1 ThuA domain-containing protein [Marixanthotalea marina]